MPAPRIRSVRAGDVLLPEGRTYPGDALVVVSVWPTRTQVYAENMNGQIVAVDLLVTPVRRLRAAELGDDLVPTPDHPEGEWLAILPSLHAVRIGYDKHMGVDPRDDPERIRDEIASLDVPSSSDWRSYENDYGTVTRKWATVIGEFEIFRDSQPNITLIAKYFEPGKSAWVSSGRIVGERYASTDEAAEIVRLILRVRLREGA